MTKKMAAPPDRDFDFTAFQSRIEVAAEAALQEVVAQNPNDEICAFALYSDSMAMTVCPATDVVARRDARMLENPDDPYFKFGPAEWAFECIGADDQFEALCTELREEVMAKSDDDDWHEWFQASLCEACIRALEAMRGRGVFDVGNSSNGFLLIFNASAGNEEAETERRMVARLNSPAIVEEHERWTLGWAS